MAAAEEPDSEESLRRVSWGISFCLGNLTMKMLTRGDNDTIKFQKIRMFTI